MQNTSQDDIRRLLRTFGGRADETINAYLAEHRPSAPLKLRIVLESVSNEGAPPLRLEVEGEVRL